MIYETIAKLKKTDDNPEKEGYRLICLLLSGPG